MSQPLTESANLEIWIYIEIKLLNKIFLHPTNLYMPTALACIHPEDALPFGVLRLCRSRRRSRRIEQFGLTSLVNC